MTDQVCYAYTSAFLSAVESDFSGVVLGHDLRPSSPTLAAACAAAIRNAGREVHYCGALPTPALALHAASLGLPALVVTGSHIPFDRNGIKFYRAEGEISKADEETMLKAIVKLPAEINIAPLPAIDLTAREAYVRRYVNYYGVGALAGIRLAVYEHSSVARDVLREILEALGATVISLGRTDTFVPIDTEAVRPEDVVQARCWAAEHQFDAVLSTDGDADRPLLGDESGTWLRGDVVGILCARYLQADTVVTPVSSNTALEKSGWFKSVARTRIGSPYVIAGMANGKGVVVGYEANGGFLLGTDVERGGRKLSALPTRDAILPMVSLLSMARERRSRLSDLLDDLPQRFTASDRLQEFPTEHSQELLVRLQVDTDYAAALLAPASGGIVAVDTTDGFRASFANGDIVHLRPSGNAPELRCYAESDLQQQAESLCATCLAGIPRN
jgi:phosphomannomutase